MTSYLVSTVMDYESDLAYGNKMSIRQITFELMVCECSTSESVKYTFYIQQVSFNVKYQNKQL